MMRRMLVAALAGIGLAAAPLAASGATLNDAGGLWSATQLGTATDVAVDCGSGGERRIDDKWFCYIDDSGAVELGVKFTTSKPVLIKGVRVYRVDAGQLTGSLWTAGGTLLATGTFGDPMHGWQDLTFPSPVPIVEDQTYIASYFAPNADYAFDWNFFTDASYTVGPLTALKSVEGNRNGVYCYVGESCGSLPTNSYNDTNYWVTPLRGEYGFQGFQQPVDTAALNTAKAGSAIPVKFSLGGDQGLSILRAGYPTATKFACDTGAAIDAIEETVNASASSLTYDAASGRYIYVWKSNKAWAGSCYRFELGLNDFTSRTFEVKFLK